MNENQKPNSIFSGKIIAVMATAAVTVGGFAAWYSYSIFQKQAQIEQTDPQNQPPQIKDNQQEVAIYLINDNLDVQPQKIAVAKSDNPEEVISNAFNYLLTNPQDNSVIPEATQLQSLEIKEDGIHIDLSAGFVTGGGSASMIGRLGQVIYTATSLDENAKVWISVDGESLETLGEEGLMVEQPMTRESFANNF